MRLVVIPLLLLPTLATAHPGHIAEVAGHDHWVAGAAIGLAILVALWGALKGRKKEDTDPDPEPEAEDTDEEQAA